MNVNVKLMTRYQIYHELNTEKERLLYLKQNLHNNSFTLFVKNKIKKIILDDKKLKELEIKIKKSQEYIEILKQEFILLGDKNG